MPSRITLTILVGYGAAIWFLMLLFRGFSIEGFFVPITFVIGAISVALILFDHFGWRLPVVSRLISRPDLRGTWTGTLDSDHIGAREAIKVVMVVHQTFSDLKMRLFTPESKSLTTTANIVVEPDKRISVVNVYRNDPRLDLQARSRPHRGTLEVMVEGAEGDRLTGEYWTDRKTTGRVALRRVSREQAKDWDHAKVLEDRAR